MNALKTSATMLAGCLLSVGLVATVAPQARADYETFTIEPGFLPAPLIGTGISGGGDHVEGCGYVAGVDSPDHILYIDAHFDYLRLYVDSPGDVTLYMENLDTGEIICVDDSNGTLLPDFSSEWPVGTYYIWIGDFDQAGYPYELYITEF